MKRSPAPLSLAKRIAQEASARKAEDIVVLDVRTVANFCDYFVIMTGTVDVHIGALLEHISRRVKDDYGMSPLHVEGESARRWVVLDYGNVIAHIMHPELREFYALERVWSRGKTVRYEAKPPAKD
jgi:ribosome-associated protein